MGGASVGVAVGSGVAVGVAVAVAVGSAVGVAEGVASGVAVGVGSAVGSVVAVAVASATGVGVSASPLQPRRSCFSVPWAECSFACEAPLPEFAFGHPPLSAREAPAPTKTTAAARRLATKTARSGVDLFIFSHS